VGNLEEIARAKKLHGSMALRRVAISAHRTNRLEELENRLLLSVATVDETGSSKAIAAFNLSSAVFVENRGQWSDDSIKYAFNGQGINVGFTDTGPVLELMRAKEDGASAAPPDPLNSADTPPPEIDSARVTMSFDGARSVEPVGVDQSETLFNYLVGDASQHRSNVPAYEKIRYPELYDGIDLLASGQSDGMKYEFHVAPGADWRDIKVSYSGSEGLTLAADGSLHVATPLGDVVEQAPVLYQVVDGNRVEVTGKFVLIDADTYGFEVSGAYDVSQELVIDPDLAWATYLSMGDDQSNAIAIDGAGNSYVTGYTLTGQWATPGAYQTTVHEPDAFVAKINPSGSSLLYATYFGGMYDDQANAIAVDALGNAYIAGTTQVNGLATPGAYQTTFGGLQDAFVAKFNPTGSSLLYATYLGGSGFDSADGITVDDSGNAYVTGNMASAGFATAGAYNQAYTAGKNGEGFVAKLNASGSSLIYATYLGGSDGDSGFGIAIDGVGNAYITGITRLDGWATDGAFDNTLNAKGNAFVAKLNASGSSLIYATYLGGSDAGGAIALDASGAAYVTGEISAAGWATAEAYNQIYSGGGDAFVAKLSPSGSSLIYDTYLGGSNSEYGLGIAVDGVGNAYVTGFTASGGWATAGAFDTQISDTDIYLAKLNATGSALLYATYVGLSGIDTGTAIVIDGSGNAYVTGASTGGFATPGAFRTNPHITEEHYVFVLKFSGLVDLFPGDTNGDKKVDFADLVAVAQNYGGSGKTRDQGDVTGDGNVDFADLVLIAQNYATPTAAPELPVPAAAIVPVSGPPPVPATSIPIAEGKPSAPATMARPTPVKQPNAPRIIPVVPSVNRKPALLSPPVVLRISPVSKPIMRSIQTLQMLPPAMPSFNVRKRIAAAVWEENESAYFAEI
jgi:hypothetical protein